MAAAAVLNPSVSGAMFAGSSSAVAPAATVAINSGLPSQLHVLLVDDEKLSRAVVGNLLRKCNYRVTAIEGGREALRLLHSSTPGTFDLILSDVMMPDINGVDLLREVRKLPFMQAVPVVMMSANEAQQQVLECIKGGADEYLVKPVTKKEVQNIWQHVWKRTQQPRVGSELKQEPSYQHASAPAASAGHGDGQYRSTAFVGGGGTGTAAAANSGDVGLRSQSPNAAFLQIKGSAGSPVGEVIQQPLRPDSPLRASTKSILPRVLLSQWLSRPNRCQDMQRAQQEAIRVFCEVLLMVQNSQATAHHTFGRIRPCHLFLHKDVSVSYVPTALVNSSMWTEEEAYRSPEEMINDDLSESSDVYALGVLFFDLFLIPLLADGSRGQHLSALRKGTLPPELVNVRPQECAFVRSLLNPVACKRPSLSSLIQSDQFSSVCNTLQILHQQRQQQATADLEVVTEFLTVVHHHKCSEVQQLETNIKALENDIESATRELDRRRAAQRSQKAGLLPRIPALCAPRDGTMSGADVVAAAERAEGLLHKRKRPRIDNVANTSGHRSSFASHAVNSSGSKHQRLLDVFPQLEQLYFERRSKGMHTYQSAVEEGQGTSDSPDVEHSHPPPSMSTQDKSCALSSQLTSFSEDLWKFSQPSSLRVKATLRYGDLLNSSNMVYALAFDKDEEFFATAGVSKRLKIFEYATVVDPHASVHYPVLEINSRSKLTSVVWSSHIKSHLACSDSEGIVQLWDANNNVELMHFEEHSKRVWSVDISKVDPTRILSGSDDGTVKLWQINQEHSTATISLNSANVCSVHFSPDSAHLVACGCANYNVYLCDLRNTSVPLAVIPGHTRTVSYVKFMTGKTLVSASIDNSLKIWDVDRAASQPSNSCKVTLSGHRNEKNFVGLSVTPDGYIACGSEDNSVYCYYQGFPMPVVSHDFAAGESGGATATGASAGGTRFVSSVCWSSRNDVLLAGNTTGAVQVLAMK